MNILLFLFFKVCKSLQLITEDLGVYIPTEQLWIQQIKSNWSLQLVSVKFFFLLFEHSFFPLSWSWCCLTAGPTLKLIKNQLAFPLARVTQKKQPHLYIKKCVYARKCLHSLRKQFMIKMLLFPERPAKKSDLVFWGLLF